MAVIPYKKPVPPKVAGAGTSTITNAVNTMQNTPTQPLNGAGDVRYRSAKVTPPIGGGGLSATIGGMQQNNKVPLAGSPFKTAQAAGQAVVDNKTTLAPQLGQQSAEYMTKNFGGTDKYIQDQLARYQGADSTLKAKLDADLARFGVKPPAPTDTGTTGQSVAGGATSQVDPTTGNITTTTADGTTIVYDSQGNQISYQAGTGGQASTAPTAGVQTINGQQYIVYPDGRQELVDTDAERSVAGQISAQQSQLEQTQAAQEAERAANQQAYDYSMGQLKGAEAVDKQAAQDLQNRRGGFYSGGLDYQLAGIGSAYATQRGQMAADFNRGNQELTRRYGAQITDINNTITSMLQAAPDMISGIIAEAAAKKQAAALDEAQITGTYMNPAAEPLFTQLMSLKQQAESPNITREARAALSKQADGLRAQLQALGVDISKLGAGSTANQATAAGYGVRTEAGRQADAAEAADTRNFEYDKNRDTIADGWAVADATGKIPDSLATVLGIPKGLQTEEAKERHWQHLWQEADTLGVIPDELAELIGKPKGTQTQAAKEFAEQMELNWDNADLNWLQEERQGAEGGGGSEDKIDIPSDATSGSYMSGLLKYSEEDPNTGKMVTKTKTDYNQVKNAFMDAYDTMFADTDAPASAINGMLIKANISPAHIKQLKKDFPEAFDDSFNSSTSSSGGGSGAKVEVPQQYQSVIADAQKKYGLTGSNLLAKIAKAESGFNPKAKNSGSGAAGMFQFMPATAKGYKIDPYNVEQAADAAGKMVSGLIAKYDGDVAKALAGYNWGGGNVDKAIKQWGKDWLKHAPKETQNYIKKIMG